MPKAGDIIKVGFKLKVPKDCTEEELEAWLRFELFENGSLPSANPLSGSHLQAEPFSVELNGGWKEW